ncbi:hydrogenase maturation protease [Bacteroidota bacterium]
MSENILVLGLGNVLMGDEGIGVKAVEYIQQYEPIENVRLLDGGTGGFHLLSLFKEYDKFIIIDATMGSADLGTIRVLKPRFASDFPKTLTSHDIGLRDLMQSAELLGELPEIELITINIGTCKVGMGISEEMEKQLPQIHKTVLSLIDDLKSRN